MTHRYDVYLESGVAVIRPGRRIAFNARLAIVAVALAMAVVAQEDDNQLSQITVQASQKVKTRQVEVSYTGIPIEQIQLSRRVGFGDLDVSIAAGRAALDKRIDATAKEACRQLSTLYPMEQWSTDNETCVAEAISAAMAQANTILAAQLKR
jgi:UrcA family protein